MDIQVFVIHVRGALQREKHIKKELSKFNIKYDFILDGNKEDITNDQLNHYFAENFREISAKTSCSLKHILACEEVVKRNLDRALIFEDDIILKPNFNTVLEGILKELDQEKMSNYLVSLENSNHYYVKKSEAVEGKYLYKKDFGRCAGAYIIDREFAKTFMQSIDSDKCHCIIDWYHNHLADKNKIAIYWSYPHIAEQGSHNGSIQSLIDNKKTGYFRRFVYFAQRLIKSKK